MEVIRIKTDRNLTRYYLADENSIPVKPVLKYIKYLDNIQMAKNTIRNNCYHLKYYYEFLKIRGFDKNNDFIEKVTIDDFALFLRWLVDPGSMKISFISKIDEFIFKKKTIKSSRVINQIIGTVIKFYDYLSRFDEYSNKMQSKLFKFISTPNSNYKGFLEGIAYEKYGVNSNVLRLKIPKSKVKTITKEDISLLINNCSNFRDKFLLMLLFKTGFRIGEALSLWVEDFELSDNSIDLKDRGVLENNAEIKTVSSPRKLFVDQELMDMFMEYLSLYHSEKVVTNHVFIKLSGKNQYKALEYMCVDNLFRSLRDKTEIKATPHVLRHSNLTILSSIMRPEELQKQAGHSNFYTTMNTYVHPSQNSLKNIRDKIAINLAVKEDDFK